MQVWQSKQASTINDDALYVMICTGVLLSGHVDKSQALSKQAQTRAIYGLTVA